MTYSLVVFGEVEVVEVFIKQLMHDRGLRERDSVAYERIIYK